MIAQHAIRSCGTLRWVEAGKGLSQRSLIFWIPSGGRPRDNHMDDRLGALFGVSRHDIVCAIQVFGFVGYSPGQRNDYKLPAVSPWATCG